MSGADAAQAIGSGARAPHHAPPVVPRPDLVPAVAPAVALAARLLRGGRRAAAARGGGRGRRRRRRARAPARAGRIGVVVVVVVVVVEPVVRELPAAHRGAAPGAVVAGRRDPGAVRARGRRARGEHAGLRVDAPRGAGIAEHARVPVAPQAPAAGAGAGVRVVVRVDAADRQQRARVRAVHARGRRGPGARAAGRGCAPRRGVVAGPVRVLLMRVQAPPGPRARRAVHGVRHPQVSRGARARMRGVASPAPPPP